VEARASFSGRSVSKTFVAAILVIVALGLAAMGAYVVKGVGAGGATTSPSQSVHLAPGTVLRQDNPSRAVTGTSQSGDDGSSRGGHGKLP
jgi:hypothetical protein